MDSFGKMVEILVTVLLLFLVPMQYTFSKAELVNRDYVKAEAVYLTDSIRNTGFLTSQMYETFLKKLAHTGNIYEIEFSHYQKRFHKTEEGILPFYEGIYSNDMLQTLFSEGRYTFNQGDFIRICIRQKNRTKNSIFRFAGLPGTGKTENTLLVYGGAVRDEIE